MKILYLAPRPHVGGLQTTLRSRINALAARGIAAEVFFFGPGDGLYLFAHIPHRIISGPAEFRKAIRAGRYDYISFIYSLDYLPHVPASFTGKIVYELRGWNDNIARAVEQITPTSRVSAIVCIARYLEPIVKQHLKCAVPVYVDGNAVDPQFRFVPPGERIWSAAPRPRRKRCVIAFVGRVESTKNWRECVDICRLAARSVNLELWIVCNPNTSRHLSRMLAACAAAGLEKRTRVVPHVPNHLMPELYATIKSSGGCMLSTSLREGLGNHILEPMACGLPIVSSNVPGKNEIITHRHNGMLYTLGDTARAARYVSEVIGNQTLRLKLARRGLAHIRKYYNPSRYVDRYLRILGKL